MWEQSQAGNDQTDHQGLTTLLVQSSVQYHPSVATAVSNHFGFLLHSLCRQFVLQETYLHREITLEQLVFDVFFEPARIVQAVGVRERVG
jgi:hypothetical protein